MKNKKHNGMFLFCILLPTTAYGMKQAGKALRPIRPIRTGPVITQQPQPPIEFPTTEPTTNIPNKNQPKIDTSKPNIPSGPMQPFQPIEPIKPFKPNVQNQNLISPKDRIEYYKKLVEEAQRYNLKIKTINPKTNRYKIIEYNHLIKQIEQAEDFTEDEIVNITQSFDILQAKIKLKELILSLEKLIKNAQELGVKDLEKFKKYADIDIDIANDMLIIDTFKESIDQQITELKDIIEKQKSANNLQPTQENKNQGPTEADFADETEQEAIARELRQAEEKTQKNRKPKKIILPKEIKESPLQEFRAQEQLRRAQEAAEQKAAAEQAQLKAEKLQKEVDQLYQEIEQEFAAEQKAQEERIATENHIKEIEQEQEKAAANKIEQQKLLAEIAEYETELERFEQEHQTRQQKMEQLQKKWQDKQTELDVQTHKEQEAHTAQQEIESIQRKKALQEVKTERRRAERKYREAEQKAQAEQKKLDNALLQLQKAEDELQLKEKSVAEDAQAIEQFEAELAQLKKTHQSILQAMNEAKSQLIEQKQKIESQTQAELQQIHEETKAKIKKAKDNLQKSKDFIAQNSAGQIAQLERLEEQYTQESTIKKQNIETAKDTQLTQINEQYRQELLLIEANFKQFEQKQDKERTDQEQAHQQARLEMEQLEAAIKADEIALQEMQKKHQELLQQKNETQADISTNYEQEIKRLDEQLENAQTELRHAQERLENERSRAEERKKEEDRRKQEQTEERIEGSGDSNIPQGINNQQPEPVRPEEGKIEESHQETPNIPITPTFTETPLIPENETTKAAVLPNTTESTPAQQETDITQPNTPQEPVKQATEASTYPTSENSTYYPTSGSTGNTAGRSTPSFTGTSQNPAFPFTPSTSYGNSTPSSAESIGWTSSDSINPYTQRIELQRPVAPKDATTTPEMEKEVKTQAQDIVWWEQLLPKWVVQYLVRKDRSLPEQPKTEETEPIEPPEEEKPIKKQTSIVKTIVETIKKPIASAISYIRGLFYS